MPKRVLDAVVILYGIILMASGLYGQFHDHKLSALITRVISGLIVFGLAAYGRTNPRVGRIGIAVVSLIIFGHAGVEYLKNHRMISLALSVSSLAVFAILGAGHMMAMKKLKSGL